MNGTSRSGSSEARVHGRGLPGSKEGVTGERVDGCHGPYARSISRPVWIRWNRTDAAFDGDAREVYSSPAPTATSRCKHPHRHQGFSSPQAEEKRIGHRPGFASGISVEGLIDLGRPSQWLDPVRPGAHV